MREPRRTPKRNPDALVYELQNEKKNYVLAGVQRSLHINKIIMVRTWYRDCGGGDDDDAHMNILFL